MLRTTYSYIFKRYINNLVISSEVKHALRSGQPVVSLESSIITHGLSYPNNLELALSAEDIIRSYGVVPAMIAFIDGIPRVGLSRGEIEQLVEYSSLGKVNMISRKNIAYAMAHKLHGGTTVSGTMILSYLSGIRVLVTGILGGNKWNEESYNISEDLEELCRTPVAVICTGLDLVIKMKKAMEYLEIKGCLVAGMSQLHNNIMGVYTKNSAVKYPYTFSTSKEAASMIHSGNKLNLDSGYMFCIPPPREINFGTSTFQNTVIDDNITELHKVREDKELEPFSLSEISLKTSIISSKVNAELLLNNARIGADVANSLSILKKRNISSDCGINLSSVHKIKYDKDYLVVIGSITQDTCCTIDSENIKQKYSNAGSISSSIGGVGYNNALSAQLSNLNPQVGVKLISTVGNDIVGSTILHQLPIDNDCIHIDRKEKTAQHISLYSRNGDLISNYADINIVTAIPLSHIDKHVNILSPKVLLVDGNVSVELLEHLVNLQKKYEYKLIFEPTSKTKAKKVAHIRSLGVYPNNDFYLITPTVEELESMFDTFTSLGKFELDNWFPVIDALQIDTLLNKIQMKSPNNILKDIIKRGIIQMSCSLLPYFPRIIVKDGPTRMYVFSIEKNPEKINRKNSLELFTDYYFLSSGKNFNGHCYGILMEYHQVPERNTLVKNTRTSRNTFTGILAIDICSHDIFKDLGEVKRKALYRAQMGINMTENNETKLNTKLTDIV